MSKTALITGITGQDGTYLSRLLQDKGYEVHGITRRSARANPDEAHAHHTEEHDLTGVRLHYGDLTDTSNITAIIEQVRPDEIYNLGAQSQVDISFSTPLYTADVDGLGTMRLLEAVRILGLTDAVRFYQASSSDLFGVSGTEPKDESTPFKPNSPYGIAKLFAFWIAVNYREAYDMFVCNGILFNHESPLRGEQFVARKISKAAARIALGLQDTLMLGNLDARRDWGFAGDYVKAMWLMLQQDEPDDYVIATGKLTSLRAFVRMAFAQTGITVRFVGSGLDEIGQDEATGNVVVRVDESLFRPTEVNDLVGDARKARQKLGWEPRTTLQELTALMVEHDSACARTETR